MSIKIEAGVRVPATLVDVFSHARSLLAGVAHEPFAIGKSLQPDDICIGPFDVPPEGDQRFKSLLTIWKHGYLPVSLGPIATVTLVVNYYALPQEINPEIWGTAEAEPGDDEDERGYRVGIDAGYHRTRASFCLATLLVTSIADRCHSFILDDGQLLKRGRIVEPAAVAAMFATHRDAGSFEELSDAFCDAVDFAPNWSRARETLARHQHSSRT